MATDSRERPARSDAGALAPRRWALGDAVVDVERHCVHRAAGEFRLAPKAVAVLVCLIEAGQRVVTRGDLMDAVWPDADVGEEVLTQSIAELRRALGEQARDGTVIETIRKSGYRLRLPALALPDDPPPPERRELDAERERVAPAPVAAAVNEAPALVSVPPAAPIVVPSPPPEPRRRAVGVWIAAAALLVTAVALLVGRLGAPDDERRWSRPVPITTDLGSEYAPALSPDGGAIAYLRSTLEGRQLTTAIEVRSLGATVSTVVARHDQSGDPRQPAWSPDGRRIAFERLDGTACRIVAVSAIGGGDEQVLGDCVVVGDAKNEISWRPDGGAIVFARPDDPADRDGPAVLYELDLATRQSRRLPIVAPRGDQFHPRHAPDGSTLAFLVGSEERASVFTVATGGGTATRLTDPPSLVRGIAWLPDARTLVLSEGRELWQVDRDGGGRRRLEMRNAVQPAIARREPLLVYAEVLSTTSNLQDYRVADADSDRRYADAGPLLFASTRHSRQASFSPDGGQLAFVSDRSGEDQVWIGPAGGGEPRRLTSLTATRTIDDLAWTADGEAVWVSSHAPDRRARIERWTARDARLELVAESEAPFGAIAAAADRAGLWVARGEAPARVERLGVATTTGSVPPDGEPAVLELGPGLVTGLADGGDGFLYFSRAGDPALHRRDRDGRAPPERLAGSQRIDDATGWLLLPDGLLLWGRRPGGEALLRLPRAGGEPELFSGMTGMFASRTFALSPDRRHLVFVSNGNREIDLRMARLGAEPGVR